MIAEDVGYLAEKRLSHCARVSVCVREPLLSAIDIVLLANGLRRKRRTLLTAILHQHFGVQPPSSIGGRSIDLGALRLDARVITNTDVRGIRQTNRNMVRRIMLSRAAAGWSSASLRVEALVSAPLILDLKRAADDREKPHGFSIVVREAAKAWFETRFPGFSTAMIAGQEEGWLCRAVDRSEEPTPTKNGDMVRACVTFGGIVQPAAQTALRNLRFRRTREGWSGWIAREKIADAQASFSDHGGCLRLAP